MHDDLADISTKDLRMMASMLNQKLSGQDIEVNTPVVHAIIERRDAINREIHRRDSLLSPFA